MPKHYSPFASREREDPFVIHLPLPTSYILHPPWARCSSPGCVHSLMVSLTPGGIVSSWKASSPIQKSVVTSMAIPTPIWERPLRHRSASRREKGARKFGVLIQFIGSEKRLATSCHISLNLLRTHAIVGQTRSKRHVFLTIFYKHFNFTRPAVRKHLGQTAIILFSFFFFLCVCVN